MTFHFRNQYFSFFKEKEKLIEQDLVNKFYPIVKDADSRSEICNTNVSINGTIYTYKNAPLGWRFHR